MEMSEKAPSLTSHSMTLRPGVEESPYDIETKRTQLPFEIPSPKTTGQVPGWSVFNGDELTPTPPVFEMSDETYEGLEKLLSGVAVGDGWEDTGLVDRYTNLLKNGFLESNLRPDILTTDVKLRNHISFEDRLEFEKEDFEKRLAIYRRQKELTEATLLSMTFLAEVGNDEKAEKTKFESFATAWRGGKPDRANMAERLLKQLGELCLENYGREGTLDHIRLQKLLVAAKKRYRGMLTFDEMRAWAITLAKYGFLFFSHVMDMNWYLYASMSEALKDKKVHKHLYDKYQLRRITKIYKVKTKVRGVDFKNILEGWRFDL